MGTHRALAQDQLRGDLLVRQAVRHQGQDLTLAVGESIRGRGSGCGRPRKLLQQAAGDRGVEDDWPRATSRIAVSSSWGPDSFSK